MLIILSVVFLASCAPSRKLPAAPAVEGYYDSTYFKLQQEQAFNGAAKKQSRKFLSRKGVATIGVTAFGIYCILAWRYDIE